MRKMRALRETREHNERKRPRENVREKIYKRQWKKKNAGITETREKKTRYDIHVSIIKGPIQSTDMTSIGMRKS